MDGPHIVTYDGHRYGLQHPLRCRPDLIGCAFEVGLRDGHIDEPPDGSHFIVWAPADTSDDPDDGLRGVVYEPVPDGWDDGMAALVHALEGES